MLLNIVDKFLVDNRKRKIAYQDQTFRSFLFCYTLVQLGTCYLLLVVLDALLLKPLSPMVMECFYKRLLEVQELIRFYLNVNFMMIIIVLLKFPLIKDFDFRFAFIME